jgi:dipeptidyl aminopeptidase/acylaminoacyl peptidase
VPPVPPYEDFVPTRRFLPALAVSPDGTTVAYSSDDSGQFQLWTTPLDGGAATEHTTDEARSVRAMAWSPDGTRLAFAADRDGDEQHQIHLLDLGTGEVTRVSRTDGRQHVLAVEPFDPTGRWLAYAANDRDETIQDVLVADLDTGGVRRIESEVGVLAFPVAFSPDGHHLLIGLVRSNTDSDVAVLDLTEDDPTLRLLTEHDGEEQHLPSGWLPDGSGVLVLTDAGREFRALVMRGLDGTVEEVHAPEHDVDAVDVSRDGSTLLWCVNEDAVHVPYVAGTDALDDPRRLAVPDGVIDAVALGADGKTAVALAASGIRPMELVTIDVADGSIRYLTDSRPPGLRAIEPVAPQVVTYPTHDGRDVPAWLYLPAGEGPHGMVLSIHGGPEAQEQARYNYSGLYQYLLAHGVGILAPNVRGSSGYGASYQRLIHRDWGGGDLGDFEHAVHHLRGLDRVDDDRIAVFGGSYGGFAALSCVSRLPELFAAGVSVVGPSNLVTFARAVPPTWRSLMAAWVGDPDEDEAFLLERSPITYVDDIVAPLFVLQGANDPRVVKAESDQVVEALRARGVEVRYDVYEDEGHGFAKRSNQVRAMTDVAAFLLDHVG